MKRLIDANKLKEEWKNGFYKKIVDALMDDAPTVMQLPENASNGDVIKAVFNNDLHINHILSNEAPDWWEAPYKEKDNDK